MGIKVEFNPDLALRAFNTTSRQKEECLPEKLEIDQVYHFLKKDQRNYYILGEVPLRETKGNLILSRPLASIQILEVIHFLKNNEVWTKGKYKIIEMYNKEDKSLPFDGYEKVKNNEH